MSYRNGHDSPPPLPQDTTLVPPPLPSSRGTTGKRYGTTPSAPAPKIKDNASETPTPPAPSPSWGKWVMVLLLGLLLLSGIGAGAVLAVRVPGSTADDEISTPARVAEDYRVWKERLVQVVTTEPVVGTLSLVDSAPALGWWTETFHAPNIDAVRAALKRRLPEGFRLNEIKLVALTPHEERGVTANYQVKLRASLSLSSVTPAPLPVDPSLPKRGQELTKLLRVTPELPAGSTFPSQGRKEVISVGQVVTLPWTVRQAVKEDGMWKVLDAEPLHFQSFPHFETKLIAGSPSPIALLRQTEYLDEVLATQARVLTAHADRIRLIEQEVAQYKQRRYASVPGAPQMSTATFGGSGSGEPTRSAARIGGSAAAGAASGALFGGLAGDSGLGAGIGAGLGLLGGLIYDSTSKSNDKKRFEEQKKAQYESQLKARNSALSAANRDVIQFEKQLYDAYEQELRALK